EALLWEQDGAGGWDPVITLNDKIDSNSGWDLKAAHDANDAGCIVGWGRLEVEPGVFENHAFLLYECPADLDGDAVVGIGDLLALLAAFGPCPDPPDPCPADLNGDGTVDTLDMLQLLANWGTCCAGRNTSPPQTVQDCIDKFCCEYANQLALERCLCAVEPENCE
ncbi:MAG: hypothetical protein IH983_10705, partial [Planctomycetes bacterium]|nr:hypothetical protein [Planctomycetota bacterium]